MSINYSRRKVSNIDCLIGKRLKFRRLELHMRQDEISQMLGVSIQQVQKYEKAINRTSSSTLYHLALMLKVPISYFFTQSPQDFIYEEPVKCSEKEIIAIIEAFNKIKKPKRTKLIKLLIKLILMN